MDDRKIEELIRMLKKGDYKARENAAKALGETRDTRAVEPLIKALEDGLWSVRKESALALGKIGDTRAAEPLIRALEDVIKDVRKEALKALVKIGKSAVELLIKMLMNKNSDIRSSVVVGLEQLEWKPRDETERIFYYIAKDDWKSIVSLGTPTIRLLDKMLLDVDTDARIYAVEALGRMGNALAVEPLIKALGDSDSNVRWRVVKALGSIGDIRAAEPLIKALVDSDSDVRSNAAEALGKIGNVHAVEPLIRTLGDSYESVRWRVAVALERICPQIFEIIFGEIQSNNSKSTIKNVDVSKLTIPMSSLTKIYIDAETHDFDMVERFITYAINYVGQKHLRKKVEVHIYGNPEKLHPNLLNSFKNLCRKVITIGKDTV